MAINPKDSENLKKAGFDEREIKHFASLSSEYIKKHNERARTLKSFDKSVKRHAIKKSLDKHSSRVELTSMLPKSKKKLSFKDITRDEDATMNWNREGKQNVK